MSTNAKDVPQHTQDTDGFVFSLPKVSEIKDDFIDEIEIEDDIEISNTEKLDVSEQPSQDIKSGPDSCRGTRSRAGDVFDPTEHAYPPKETKTGLWRKKRKSDTDKQDISPNAVYQKEAQKMAQLYGEIHKIPFGEGGKIKALADLDALSNALTVWMQENGLKELNPTLLVLLTAAGYTSLVASRKENEDKITRIKHKISGFVSWFKLKVFGIEKKKAKSDKKDDENVEETIEVFESEAYKTASAPVKEVG